MQCMVPAYYTLLSFTVSGQHRSHGATHCFQLPYPVMKYLGSGATGLLDLQGRSSLYFASSPWTGGSSLSLGLGQPWPCLDPFLLFALLFGIAFHLQLALLSYHPIFLHPYHFLKLVSFLGANRTKSASVCPWLLRGAI